LDILRVSRVLSDVKALLNISCSVFLIEPPEEAMRTCESVDELARELGVTRRCLYKWRTKLEAVEAGEEAARPSTYALAHRKEILPLKRLIAAKPMEVDFLKGALQTVEARRQKKGEIARWHLRRNPRSDVIARQLKYRAYM
jgi:transposase-like protein